MASVRFNYYDKDRLQSLLMFEFDKFYQTLDVPIDPDEFCAKHLHNEDAMAAWETLSRIYGDECVQTTKQHTLWLVPPNVPADWKPNKKECMRVGLESTKEYPYAGRWSRNDYEPFIRDVEAWNIIKPVYDRGVNYQQAMHHARDIISSTFSACYTYGQLRKVWPEIFTFFPKNVQQELANTIATKLPQHWTQTQRDEAPERRKVIHALAALALLPKHPEGYSWKDKLKWSMKGPTS